MKSAATCHGWRAVFSCVAASILIFAVFRVLARDLQRFTVNASPWGEENFGLVSNWEII